MLAITGYSGFIGKEIAKRLPFPQKRFIKDQMDGSEDALGSYYIGNLLNHKDIDSFLEDTSTLVHLACSSTPRSSFVHLYETFENDLLSTIDLFETFAKKNANGHIIFASTGGNMYQTGAPFIPRIEQELPKPASGYSIQKLAAEEVLRLLCQQHGIKATVFRISNPYGVLLPSTRGQGVIGVTFSRILANEALPIIDSPDSVRDYLFLDDLAQAFKIAIEIPPEKGKCRLFNVSSGVGYSLHDVLALIEKVTGVSIKKEYAKQLPAPSWSVLSPQLIEHTLGWKPQVSLAEGLELMWQKIRV